jgi:hypothetical protein
VILSKPGQYKAFRCRPLLFTYRRKKEEREEEKGGEENWI